MKYKNLFNILFILTYLTILAPGVHAENIDPDNDDSQYIWGENIGWLNLEPGGDGGSGVDVSAIELKGYMWGENIGWINLSPPDGGVFNDGNGTLSGYAWGENVGWINFAPTGGGVTINACGDVSAIVGVAGLATGVWAGLQFLERGFRLGMHSEGPRANGFIIPLFMGAERSLRMPQINRAIICNRSVFHNSARCQPVDRAVLGMFVGAALVQNWGIAGTAEGTPLAGKIAVITGFIFLVLVGLLYRERDKGLAPEYQIGLD